MTQMQTIYHQIIWFYFRLILSKTCIFWVYWDEEGNLRIEKGELSLTLSFKIYQYHKMKFLGLKKDFHSFEQ
jgi:hypothetical protein